MPRKGENIFKRKDGRWEARYIDHYENGKAKYIYLYGKSYREVKEKKIKHIQDLNRSKSNMCQKQDILFKNIAELWMKNIKNSVKESTYVRYIQIIDNYLNPYFGNIQIKNMNTSEISDFTNHLLNNGGKNNKPLSPKTVTDIICVLKAILKFAETNNFYHLDYRQIKYPQKNKKQIKIISTNEQKKIEKILNCSTDSFEIGLFLTLYTGLRIGELCALKWENIDLKNNTIKVKNTIQRIKNLDKNSLNKTKIIIDSPKTKSSYREIPIPKFISLKLKSFKNSDEIFLLSETTIPMEPHQCYIKYKKFLEENDINNYSFHALRHTFATRCVESGFDIKTLSEILGHRDITTTLKTYVHPSMELKRKQMEKLKPMA